MFLALLLSRRKRMGAEMNSLSTASAVAAPATVSWLGTPARRLWLLVALALLASLYFMTSQVQAEWSFVLPLRGKKLATMWTVAFAIGVSTVLFQTVTNNRILTPAVMGFDALFQLIQSVLAFSLGAAAMQIPELSRFGMNVGLMVLLSTSLFVWLFRGQASNLHLLLLVGIVAGIFFAASTTLSGA